MRGVDRIPWSDDERAQLRQLHANGLTYAQIGRLMGRSANSVHSAVLRLGLVKADRAPQREPRPVGHPRAPRTTLPPLRSLSMRGNGECTADEPWDGVGWPRNEDFWP